MKSYEDFQTTLDRVFKRDDVRGEWGSELDGDVAWHLGRAFVSILKQSSTESPRVVVGRDMREGSPTMAAQLIRGIEAAGGTTVDLGMCGTELIYFATGEDPTYHGGAMVTASHNPPKDAGVKFVRRGARPLDTNELDKLKQATARSYASYLQGTPRGSQRREVVDRFVNKLLDVAGLVRPAGDTVHLKVVVEAGNGMGGVTMRPFGKPLEELLPGIRLLFCDEDPDGQFPVCTPNPVLPEYLDLLSLRVQEESADLGICFDGDADRAGFVDSAGQPIDPAVVAILLFERLSRIYPDRHYVMGNLNSSLLLTDHFKNRSDGKFVMTPVGHAKIKSLMRTKDYCDGDSGQSRLLFASEHSGHYFYPDFYDADSGVTTALFMIQEARRLVGPEAKRPLSEQLDQWRGTVFPSGEINQTVESDQVVIARIQQVAGKFLSGRRSWRGVVESGNSGNHEVEEFDANTPYPPKRVAAPDLRVDSAPDEDPRWWFSLRKSGNEPKLRLNVESTDKDHMQQLRDELLHIIQAE